MLHDRSRLPIQSFSQSREVDHVDKDTVKGKGKDIAGRVERQVGEWTGRKDLQAEGAGKQVEGKVQKGVGKVKEAGRDIADKLKRPTRDGEVERDEEIKDRKRKVA
jgi:uncharacterized protein YjbJ (UPF0337 family)